MSTSRVGLERPVKFLGSDLGGITDPPDGVHDLLEEWRKASTIERIQYRLITREPGASTMKRLTPRGLKNGQFLEVRVNPDRGGNGNCWLISLVLDKESASEIEQKLRTGADAVNNRRPERHTPTPAAPVAALPDPYVAMSLADLREQRTKMMHEVSSSERFQTQMLELNDRLLTDIATLDANIAGFETELRKARNIRAEREESHGEASRSISQARGVIEAANKEIARIDTVIETKVRAEARDIATPLRAMMVEEAERRGLSVEDVLRELTTQPPTT